MALHHFHLRKRIYQKKEKYPSKKKWVRRFDELMYAIGIIGPIATIPQAVQVWAERNAAGMNLFTWSIFVVVAWFWLAYALLHKEKPLILMYLSWIIIQSIVVAGILVYG